METFLLSEVIGQSLDTYLDGVKNKHTKVHDGLGGQGGRHARATDAYLRSQFNFTDEDIIVVVSSSSKFLKKYVSQRDFYSSDSYPVYPLNCSANPWKSEYASLENIVMSEVEPGYAGGPNCTCVDYYFQDDDTLTQLMTMFFDKYIRTDSAQYVTPQKLFSLSFEDRVHVMQAVCSRLSYDGDMVGSASPIDPIFWVSHGAVEKLFQRIVMADMLTDIEYLGENECSGHAPWGTKAWLEGYYLMDASVDMAALSNADMVSYNILLCLLL